MDMYGVVMQTGQVIEILQVMGITAGMKGGVEMEQRGGGGRFMPKTCPRSWPKYQDYGGQFLTKILAKVLSNI